MKDREKLSGPSNRWNIGAGGDLPIGFGLSLAANEKSMAAFAEMNDEQKQTVVDIAATSSAVAAVTEDGQVYVWGNATRGEAEAALAKAKARNEAWDAEDEKN